MNSDRRPKNTITSPDEDNTIVSQAANSLDESVAQYDIETLSRLRQARQSALAQNDQSLWRRFAMPASAAFAGVAAIIMIPFFTVDSDLTQQTPSTYTAAEDAELVENLDLVLWLMDEGDHAS